MGLPGQVVFLLNQVKILPLPPGQVVFFTKSGQNSAPQVVVLPDQVKILPRLPVSPSRFGAIQPNSMKVDDLYKVALMLLDRALEDNSQVTLVASIIL